MAKILNLDALAAEQRVLTIGGVDYPVEEMSVENFIETSRSAERLRDETSMAVQVEETVKMIQRSVPTIGEDVLRKMPLQHLQTIVAFIRGEDPVEQAAPAAEGAEAGK